MNKISKRFNEIKESFKTRIINYGLTFDEDVFSQTILQCNEKMVEDCIDEEMIKYFWRAFKNNTLRELNYLRNKTTDEIPELVIYSDDDITEEFNEISNIIINKFGEELYRLFVLHANGTPYSELERMTFDTKLKYKFRKIREYVRNNYVREF